MIISVIYCILVTVILIVFYISSYKERQRLIEMLVAKDYADFKSFEIKPENKKDHMNMLSKREKVLERDKELE